METKTNLSVQAEMVASRLMSDKRFSDKVSATARKHDGTFAINSDKEFYQLQMMLCDAFNALTGYSVQGKPISEEETDIIAQCLTELHRLSNHEWLRMSGCFSRKPLAN